MAIKTKKDIKCKKSTQSQESKPKGKKTAREVAKYPGLNPKFFSKVKQEFHDIDYIDELSPKDKEYLSSFMEEKLGARFNHGGKVHHKSKTSKREIYTENNARQRDVYAQGRASGRKIDIDPEIAMDMWQERYMDTDFESIMLKADEVPELMSKREFIKLMSSGAILPFEMVAFYIDFYKLEES